MSCDGVRLFIPQISVFQTVVLGQPLVRGGPQAEALQNCITLNEFKIRHATSLFKYLLQILSYCLHTYRDLAELNDVTYQRSLIVTSRHKLYVFICDCFTFMLVITYCLYSQMSVSLVTIKWQYITYKPSRYKSEALRLLPQRCNTAKPTRCCNSFPQVQSDCRKICSCGSGCSFYRTQSR
jgi:hypothetical protein